MDTGNEKIIKQLNDLVEINNDRTEGYEKAATETKDNELQVLFKELASHSRVYKNDLSAKIITLGGQPTEGTKTTGKLFRAWMDVKAALSSDDRKAVLQSCERGEDAALETYNDALKTDSSLTAELRTLVSKQQQEILKDHDRIKSLRDAVIVK